MLCTVSSVVCVGRGNLHDGEGDSVLAEGSGSNTILESFASINRLIE